MRLSSNIAATAAAVLLAAAVALIAAPSVDGHVIAVYQGMDLPIRGAGAQDEAQTTAGPCGGSDTFGSSGVSKLSPGELINLQLKYAQNHRIPGGNSFMVAMACSSNANDLGSEDQYRLSQAANQQNRVAMNTVNVPDENVYSMPLQLPAKSPAGVKLTDGTYCTVSIMDERDWGGCVDIRVTQNPGPIIAGVVAPVTLLGAAGAIWYTRGRVAGKLLPESGAANPDRKMWQTIRWAFVTMVFSIISCAAPAWSASSQFGTGPWLYCPTSNAKCSDSVALLQFDAIYAVRFFVITAVLASVFALALPVLVFYNRMPDLIAAKIQIGLFLYAGVSQFIAFIVWVSIFGGGSNPGYALYLDIVAFAFSFASMVISITWKNHIAAAPPADTQISIVTTPPASTSAKSTPASPTSEGSTSTGASSAATPLTKSYASPFGTTSKPRPVAQQPAAPQVEYPKKFGKWEEIWDEENQAYYFFNHSNGESSWERPAGWPTL